MDAENSARARMKREPAHLIEAQDKAAHEFQTKVVSELEAMHARKTAEADSPTPGHDFQAIDKSLTEVQRQAKYLEDIRTWSQSIQNNAGKVIDGADRMQKALDGELEELAKQIEQLKAGV